MNSLHWAGIFVITTHIHVHRPVCSGVKCLFYTVGIYLLHVYRVAVISLH